MKEMIIFLIPVFFFGNSVISLFGQKKPKPFKLAIVQMKVDGGRRPENLKRAGDRIAEAATHGARVVLLPEAMDLGWTDPSALTEAQPVPAGETSRFLAKMAEKYKVYVCSGLVEQAGDKVFNSAVLINPEGDIILRHRKIRELDIGFPYYANGDRLNVVETEFGTIGLMICADATAQDRVLTRALGYMQADVILSPSSWAVPADYDNVKEPYGGLWRDAYIPVARDFRIWIASVSNVGPMTAGPWKGWKGIGSSMVVNPDGEVVLTGPFGQNADTIMYVDVQPEARPARGTEWEHYWKEQQSEKQKDL